MADATPTVNRIVMPGSVGSPSVPDSFLASLRQYDRSLVVSWNHIRKRFIIEQCVEHFGNEHSHLCRRVYVLTAQDADGYMMPLGDRVMDMIRQADVSRAGYGPGDHKKFCRDKQNELEADRAKLEKEQDEVIRYGSKHNRRQLLKAVHLIQQHNLTPNK